MKTRTFLVSIQSTTTSSKWKKLNRFLGMLGCAYASCLLGVPYLGTCFSFVAQSRLMIRAFVDRVAARLVSISPLIRSAAINNRIYAGLVLVSIVAPLSSCIHMFMDKDAEIVGWYYYSYFYLFMVLGPYFFCLSIVTAAFLWIPPLTKRIKFSQRDIKFQLTRLLSIPFGLIVGKIIWLFQVTSHEEFHRLPSGVSVIGGLVIGYAAIRFLDYLVWRQEHVMNALIDSLEGLFSIPDLDHNQRTSMAKPYWDELRKFNSKY